MSAPIPPPKSTARTWLRVLAWIIPGVGYTVAGGCVFVTGNL